MFLPTAPSLRRSIGSRPLILWGGVLFVAWINGCAPAQPLLPAAALPVEGSFSEWSPLSAPEQYSPQTLFRYMNGSAEFFILYGFEELAVRRYGNETGAELAVEIWRLRADEDAYGLFSQNRPEQSVSFGKVMDGGREPGSRIYFWQDRFYVILNAIGEVDDITLRLFAESISNMLPGGGERPSLLAKLPDRPTGNPVFFHQELSVQNQLWLGGENVLGLSPETDGVLAEYRLGGGSVKLLLVKYPLPDSAAAVPGNLRAAGIRSLLAASASGDLACAVFGGAPPADAEALCAEALAVD